MKKLIAIIIFGIFFGLLEAIVVTYLRQFIDPSIASNYGLISLKNATVYLNLYAITFLSPQKPVLLNSHITTIESFREFSTIIMLLCIGYLSGSNFKQRLGAFLVAFGFWDIFYYVFLAVLVGWPKSIFDLDVYFLIPVVWAGPVITPLICSTLIIIGGATLFLKNKN